MHQRQDGRDRHVLRSRCHGTIVERLLAERLDDGGWNCEVENGSVRSSFDTTINVLDGLLEGVPSRERWRRRGAVRSAQR